MLMVSRLWKTAPAMPALLGRRISPIPSPIATRENNSLVLKSFRNSVARSAFSIFVASTMTRWSSEPSSISDVTSATTSRNFISFSRDLTISSIPWAFWSDTAAWSVIPCTISRSSLVNLPRFLFRIWITPITSPRTVLTGAQTMFLVTYPVCSSILELNRSSA